MMNKVRILCKYIGSRRSVIIGGVPVMKNSATTVAVDESTYKFLKKGEECGWMQIIEDNYEEFCNSRLRRDREKKAKIVVSDAKTKFKKVEEVKEEPKKEEIKEEVKAPKKKTKKAKEKE